MTAAEIIVESLLREGALVRVCALCEQEFGRKVKGDNITHGYCKRHLSGEYRKLGMADKAAQVEAQPDSTFPPDMAKEPPAI